MKSIVLAAALAAASIAAPALAQTPAPAPAAPAAAPAAAGKVSVDTTPISEVIKNPGAKAALEKVLPPIVDFYDQIGGMTIAQLPDVSGGQVTVEQVKQIQAEFDKLK